MSKFAFAFAKKQNFVPNCDKTRYVEISGCPIESVNGTYYQMDPITINDYTYNSCFTNGIYMLEFINLLSDSMYLYELDNSVLIQKFRHVINEDLNFDWINSKTSELVPEMNSRKIGDWHGLSGGTE